MYEIEVTPGAAVALLLSNNYYPVKGASATRASLDAERWLLENDPLVEVVTVKDKDEKVTGQTISATFKEARKVRLEKHVYEHLKKAHEAAADSGEVFGRKPGMGALLMSDEATRALEKAAEVPAEKTPTPTLVDKGRKRA